MDFVLQIRSEIKTPSQQLLERPAVWSGTTADWGAIGSDIAPITNQETNALKAKLKTTTPDFVKAGRIKHLMLQGKGPSDIAKALRNFGWGYGLSTIKHYHAALSAA